MMEENKITLFLKRNYWTCLMGLGCIVVFSISLDRFLTQRSTGKNQDYFTIQKMVANYKTETLSGETIETIRGILKRRPELHADYDGLLALSLLQQEHTKEATTLAASCLKRGEKNVSPLFADFAKTSLLINEGNLTSALSSAKHLSLQLEKEKDLEELQAFNLLRLAFLEKKCGSNVAAKEAFEKLQTLSCFNKIADLYKTDYFTLKDFFS